jgi:hypothetical protein
MTIHTPSLLARKGHRLDRLNDNVERVLTVMRVTGATLQRTNQSATTRWALSNGMAVTERIARIVITHANVVGVGDCLFDSEMLSQTWHYVKTR